MPSINFIPSSTFEQKPANTIKVLSPNIIKQGDQSNDLRIQLLRGDVPVNLTGKTVLWSGASSKGKFVTDREAVVASNGEVTLSLMDEDAGFYGEMRVELKVIHEDGKAEKFPANDFARFTITYSLDDITQTPVFYASVAFFEQKVSQALEASVNAEQSAENADNRALYVEQQGDVAEAQGLFAQEKGTEARDQAAFAQQVAEENKTNWKQEVATVALRDSTYPNPQIGDTVRITGEARIDRFNGTEWITTDRYNPAVVDELTVKLAETDSLISSAASIPRYTFNPKQNFDTLIAQMREEMAKASKIIVTRDAGGATYFDVIRKINSTGGNVTVRIEADVNGTVTPIFKKADTVLFGGISGNLAMTSISEGIWEKTFSPTESTKYFINIGINIPNTEPSTTFANITKLSIVQDGVELVTELNRRLSGATGFIGATQITADYGYRHNLKNNGEVRAPKIIYVSHTGITSGLGESSNKALRWDYFADTVYPFLKGNTSFVVLESGIYRMANRTQILKVVSADKVSFVCPNGKAIFDCGEEKPTSVWSEINGSDFISVPYDPVNHWNASVKDGTLSPIVAFLESSTKTRLKLTRVASQADAQLTDGSYYYDFANKKMYINWPNGVSYYFSVPEVQSGFRIEHKDAEINFINIDVKSAETSAFFVIPTAYGKGKISWYNCAASSSGSGDDFHIQYIDTDMLNCRSSMSGNDGFNFHFEGVSNLVNCESWGAFNDGMSHHENTQGYVWNTRGLHNGTSFSTPAYGAFVYHESCYSEGNGYDNPRETYSGGYAVLGGEGYPITKAIYVNCESVNDERGICATTVDGNAAVLFAQNCIITNPSKVGYKASNSAELLTVNPQGSLTQEGSNIKVI